MPIIKNPVLILTRNCLELTKRCLVSVIHQDVGVDVMFIDNGSTDGTVEWIKEREIAKPGGNVTVAIQSENLGVSRGWNLGLYYYFSSPWMCDHILVINNDVVLPPWFYSTLIAGDADFVSGISVNEIQEVKPCGGTMSPHPDFSAFLITKKCWETVGQFDEGMKFYASDLDYHIRAHRKGIHLYGAAVPFYHERSSTLKLATPEERAEIEAQANRDRAYLKKKWGVDAWSDGYDAMFREELFGIEK